MKVGEKVKFKIIDNFTGEEVEKEGLVIGSAKKGIGRFVAVEEYGEVTDDDFVVESDRRLFLVNSYDAIRE